jgi:hypothetical protein
MSDKKLVRAGARDFPAAATHIMTECPVITAADFDFPPGDHAAPGLSTRRSFTDYRTVCRRK